MKFNKLLILTPLVVSMLAACSPAADDNTVVFWHSMGHEKAQTLQNVIDEYEELNPGKTILQSSQGGTYEDLANKINLAIPAATNPTMAFAYPDNVARYINSGVVERLDQYIDSETLGFTDADGTHTVNGEVKSGVEDFIPGYWAEGTEYQLDGTYSVPFYKSTEVMFYNEEYFGGSKGDYTVPTTWDELVALGEQIMIDHPEKRAGFGYDSDANLLITQAAQRNIPYTVRPETDEDNPFAFKNEQFVALADELSQLILDKTMLTKGTIENNAYTSTLFTDEDIIITIGSTGGTSYNVSANFGVGVAPAPYSNDNAQYIQQGPSVVLFSNATEKQKELAWDFYKFATNSENGTRVALQNNYDPVRVSAHETDIYKNFVAAEADLFAEVCGVTTDYEDYYYVSPSFVGSDFAREEVEKILSLITISEDTPQEAVDKAYSNCITRTA